MSCREHWASDCRWRRGEKHQLPALGRHCSYVFAVKLLSQSGLVLSAGADEEIVVGWDSPCFRALIVHGLPGHTWNGACVHDLVRS